MKPTTDKISVQRNALFAKLSEIVKAAAASNVNVLCFQEAWSKLSLPSKQNEIIFVIKLFIFKICHLHSAREKSIHGVSLLKMLSMDHQLFSFKM